MHWLLPEDARLPQIQRLKEELDQAWDGKTIEVDLSHNAHADLSTLQLIAAIRRRARDNDGLCILRGESKAVTEQMDLLYLTWEAL